MKYSEEVYDIFTFDDTETVLLKCKVKDIKSVEIPFGVERIGERAFEGCWQLENLIVPDSVIEIGNSAFKGCHKLCYFEIPTSVQKIGSCLFAESRAEIKFQIPKGVVELDRNCLADCNLLSEIVVSKQNQFYKSDNGVLLTKDGKTLIKYPPYKHDETYKVPDGVEVITEYAFANAVFLNNIIFSNKVCIIDEGAFCGCKQLKHISLPSNLDTISFSLFDGCTSLNNIEISNSVTNIYADAFKGCLSLKNISLPNNLSYIENSAFDDCKKLENINVSLENPHFQSYEGILYSCNYTHLIKCPIAYKSQNVKLHPDTYCIEAHAFEKCINILSVEMDDGVYHIGEAAFRNCKKLLMVYLSNNLRKITDSLFMGCISLKKINFPKMDYYESNAFMYCKSLTNVLIPEGTNDIGRNTFHGCHGLKCIYIPRTVKCIFEDVFTGCHNINEIHIKMDSIGWVKETAFSDVEKSTCKLYIPMGTSYMYKHHPAFKDFVNVIIED